MKGVNKTCKFFDLCTLFSDYSGSCKGKYTITYWTLDRIMEQPLASF